ncbi:hypothetical protein [Kribbella sp. VKM Ac-2568]|uniref:hypothetical protein n=1 Tax=Kribbella sp. VKM Ac-2568 TaxID=2512219 RepID=UPI001A7E7FF2|nr:hypothetical protein [Kribbella sp. VKM Ac-2568]
MENAVRIAMLTAITQKGPPPLGPESSPDRALLVRERIDDFLLCLGIVGGTECAADLLP